MCMCLWCRFLPEPDLPALTIDATDVQFFQDTMPLLPAQQQKALEVCC